MTPTEICALLVAASSFIGGGWVIVKDLRGGKLQSGNQQLAYMNDLQDDVRNLQSDLSRLWQWAVAAIGVASRANVELPPLPTRPPAETQQSGKT